MLTEVNLSPKPGLVDRLNCGAQSIWRWRIFHRSAGGDSDTGCRAFIWEYGASCSACHQSLSGGPASIGMACEAAMFRATAGANTHKGKVFSRWADCAPPLGRSNSYASRSPQKHSALAAADFAAGARHARIAPEQPTVSPQAKAAVSVTTGD